MQKILATGAIGLVGSRFVEMFKHKYDLANIDILSGVDITDKSSVEKFVVDHPAGTLIHLAAFTDTNKAWEEKGNTDGICYKVNVVGTKNLAEVCAYHGIHLIHVSTDFVFDGTKEGAYVEDDATAPLEWYGETKAIAESVVKDSGVSYTIVRIAYPYRANFDNKPDLIKKIREGLESGKLYPQFGDTIITPTFVDDIARAFDKIIELKPQGIYHVTGSTSLSPYELAQKVAVSYGFGIDVVKEGSLVEYLKTASRPFAARVAMDNSKAAKDLGLAFAGIDEGLAEIKKQQGL
jgi:dTDP-4-dehydrorhamnose reductase